MALAAIAKLCRDCASGLGAQRCVLCGDPLRNGPVPAYLCSTCAFGDGKNRCVKCGKPALSSSAPTAMICSFCAASLAKRQSCAKCGRHINVLQSQAPTQQPPQEPSSPELSSQPQAPTQQPPDPKQLLSKLTKSKPWF